MDRTEHQADERAKAAEQRKQSTAGQRDTTPPSTPDTGLVRR